MKGEKIQSEVVQTGKHEEETTDVPSIDACASLLAMMDERSYQRNLLCSANRFAREILQPLSLPWMHKCNPVTRNMPFDLDDMAEILMADDGSYTPHENGPFGFGRFDVGQLRRGPINTRLATSSDSWCSASRRSDDPGILEVSSVILPLRYHSSIATSDLQDVESSYPSERDTDNKGHCEEVMALGELTLRCHEHSFTNKRRKVESIRSCAKYHLVSVKVNGSSSRSSLFGEIQMDSNSRYGRLLEATLPAEVQSGRILSTVKAQKIAENLGTYDWRHGLSNASSTGKTANRLSCGRTRLIWTEKSPSDQPQKVFFSSLLTGIRIEGANQKRPRDIKLAIRVDGEVFGSESSEKSPCLVNTLFVEKFPLASPPRLLFDVVDHPRAQCMMDDEEFVKTILNDAPKSGSDRSKVRGRSASSQAIFDCLPDSNGLIGVVCSSSGKVSGSCVHECFNRAAQVNTLKLCTVCWAPDVDQNNLVTECSDCGVLVHLACCYDRGETFPPTPDIAEEEKPIWRCAVCCHKTQIESIDGRKDASIQGHEQAKKSKRRSRLPRWLQDSHVDDPLAAGRSCSAPGDPTSHGIKCALCPYQGGAMSQIQFGTSLVWIHEICRTWWRGKMRIPPSLSTQSLFRECALCGCGKRQAAAEESSDDSIPTISEYLVKCAASRCQVYFHPMCGLFSSKLYELSNTVNNTKDMNADEYRAESPQEADRRLSSCFTLTALDCEVTIGSNGKDSGTRQVVKLPIAFCGFHNPKREASFRGLYPAGRYINTDIMRIPALH